MATHSSFLAWDIPWTEESGGLRSMGLQRVGQDLVTKQQQLLYWQAGYFTTEPPGKTNPVIFDPLSISSLAVIEL